ncbi:MAG: RsmD family RNA methyltransferase [Leptospirales bacterium]
MLRILTGSLKGIPIPYHPQPGLRPTTQKVREAVSNILKNDWHDASVADLFSGTGAYGLEAFSNGATRILWVERDKKLFQAFRKFLKERFPDRDSSFQILQEDALSLLKRWDGDPVDILILDPPYHWPRKEELLSHLNLSAIVGSSTLIVLEFHHKDPYHAELVQEKGLELLKMYAYGESRVVLLKRQSHE